MPFSTAAPCMLECPTPSSSQLPEPVHVTDTDAKPVADAAGPGTAVAVATVVFPSKALDHAKSCVPALEAIFKSAVPKEPGFRIQSGYVDRWTYMDLDTMSSAETVFLMTSASLFSFSQQTIAEFSALMEPYPLIIESEKDTVVDLGGPDSWPRLISKLPLDESGQGNTVQEIGGGDGNNHTDENADQRNINARNTVSFALETNLNDDDGNLLQSILTTGTVAFKYDHPNATATLKHFATSTQTTRRPALTDTGRLELSGRETYGLIHVVISVKAGRGHFRHRHSPTLTLSHYFIEIYRPDFLLRLVGRVWDRFRDAVRHQSAKDWRHSVAFRRLGGRNLEHLLWNYPIIDEALREQFSLPCQSSRVYRKAPSTLIRYTDEADRRPKVFSCEQLTVWALPTPLVRDRTTPPPIFAYRNVAISTVISFRQTAQSSAALGIEHEAPSEQLVCEEEVQFKDSWESDQRPISRVSLTTSARVPQCVSYCEDVHAGRQESFRIREKVN